MTFLDRLFGLEVKNKENKQFKPQVGSGKRETNLIRLDHTRRHSDTRFRLMQEGEGSEPAAHLPFCRRLSRFGPRARGSFVFFYPQCFRKPGQKGEVKTSQGLLESGGNDTFTLHGFVRPRLGSAAMLFARVER